MKKLFIYSSYTGNGDVLVEIFKEKGFEIRKVKEEKRMPKSFFWGMMVGGFRAAISAKGKLVDYNSDVTGYDEIVIGTPIWNGSLPPTTNAIIASTSLKDKNVKFVIYSGSGEGKRAIKQINKLLGEKEIIFLKEPKKYKEELDKLNKLFE